jgi:hypothetical protein
VTCRVINRALRLSINSLDSTALFPTHPGSNDPAARHSLGTGASAPHTSESVQTIQSEMQACLARAF